MLQYEYARSALKLGLKLEEELGVNPYKFGLIGRTDSHTSLATADQDKLFAKHSGAEPSPSRATHEFLASPNGSAKIMGWEQVASGYAAVWPTENTRAAIFDALERKEVSATTGPRMTVRLFGGFDFQPGDARARGPAAIGYARGLPMGSDLTAAPSGKAPNFLVAALKDPIGANLGRIQIVKGWQDANGALQERVYDVAWSDAQTRRPDTNGKVPSVGDTIDVANATKYAAKSIETSTPKASRSLNERCRRSTSRVTISTASGTIPSLLTNNLPDAVISRRALQRTQTSR